ncbi:XRE family transcriptional regulator [Neorhizobium sp. P12A]|jgi:transcriptional regulator with XRE-family HTH domain|uniref:helix-turn-helix domain-containing protein n=1 Tax=Rhizobium/Agrobacterium group TaxID=227290 RepID=UPI001044D7CC|nr:MULTISPECIES: helix-turn-helix transcriptional regulator [Rhizobium/Agrobacterium group]KAA0701018.1 XRE family transcriptional regulator [Neorhizobium sp. P12A]TCR78347.1 helix-turn-helix protein [Rhizobium sp. BK376]
MSISLNDFDSSVEGAVAVAEVGTKVKAARETAGYSIEDLAVTTGLANSEITEIEEGHDADPAKLKRVAHALQVPTSAFLGQAA